MASVMESIRMREREENPEKQAPEPNLISISMLLWVLLYFLQFLTILPDYFSLRHVVETSQGERVYIICLGYWPTNKNILTIFLTSFLKTFWYFLCKRLTKLQEGSFLRIIFVIILSSNLYIFMGIVLLVHAPDNYFCFIFSEIIYSNFLNFL